MPLIKSGSRAAVSENISELVHAGHPQKQAVAAALSNARRYGAHMAGGGFAPPMGERFAARQMMHQGFLHSTVPGRTDKLPISVKGGAYVLPADHVAALGQGNSLAGADIVNRMFKMGPYGTPPMGLRGTGARVPHLNLKAPMAHADGGNVISLPQHLESQGGGHGHGGKPTPIVAAGGEIVIPPEKIMEYFGDIDKGHKALDKWVVARRKHHIKELRTLKPPRKD